MVQLLLDSKADINVANKVPISAPPLTAAKKQVAAQEVSPNRPKMVLECISSAFSLDFTVKIRLERNIQPLKQTDTG